jgi:hypothetical protein
MLYNYLEVFELSVIKNFYKYTDFFGNNGYGGVIFFAKKSYLCVALTGRLGFLGHATKQRNNKKHINFTDKE